MAKATNTQGNSSLSIDAINDGLYAERIGVHSDMQPIDREAAFDFFEKAEDKNFETLGGGEYLEWDKWNPGKYVFIFNGTTTWIDNTPNGQGKTVTAVKLEDKEGKEWICAAKLLVDSLSKVQQLPCMVRIDYQGKKQSKSGNKFFNLNVQVSRNSLRPNTDSNSSDIFA